VELFGRFRHGCMWFGEHLAKRAQNLCSTNIFELPVRLFAPQVFLGAKYPHLADRNIDRAPPLGLYIQGEQRRSFDEMRATL